MIQRFLELERRMAHLERRLGQIDSKATQAGQSVAQVWSNPAGSGSGGGGGGAFRCIIPAIAGGASGTANVYQVVGGSTVLFATGATIWNPYNDATTSGRPCTLNQNPDGSFLIYGQGCT